MVVVVLVLALTVLQVSEFIEARDGAGPQDKEAIFLTDGASAGVKMLYQVRLLLLVVVVVLLVVLLVLFLVLVLVLLALALTPLLLLLQAMLNSATGSDGVLVPIPQYPLYSAMTTMFNAHLVPYFLDESSGWAATVTELERTLVHKDPPLCECLK